MTTEYRVAETHHFTMFGKSILFNVETMLFYEVSPVVHDVISLLTDSITGDPVQSLQSRYPEEEIKNGVVYLMREGFLREGPSYSPPEKPLLKKRSGIRHLELMVTHDCNMRCRYCYGSLGEEDWGSAPYLYGARTKGMSLKTARKGVDFLLENSGGQKELSIIFFGGEPLLAFELLENIIPYIRQRSVQAQKKVNLSLSTNGLLLSRKTVDFLVENKVGCQVSIDGPREIHDRNRRLANGQGSYEKALHGIRRLVSARPGRTPARATVSHSKVDLSKVLEHLLSLGFGSVHIEPAIGKSGDLFITGEDVQTIIKQNEVMALFLVKSVKNNRFFNYSNLVRFIRQTRVIRERLAHYCGAGRTYFALSQEGDFYPCHRFVGMEEYRMGDLEQGMDLSLRKKILNLTVDDRPVCRDCWARYLCGGGCWKHAVDMHGGLEVPDNDVSCTITRHLIECAMAINSELNVSDKQILNDMYEETTEPYLVPEDGKVSHDGKKR